MAAFICTDDLNALVGEYAYHQEMADKAADGLEGLDLADRDYYDERAYWERRCLVEYAEKRADLHPILYA